MSNNYPGMMVVGFLLLTLCCSALAEPGASTFSRTAAQGIMSPMRFSALLPTIHTPAAVTSQEAHDTLRRILARREFEQYRDKPLTKDNKGFLAQFFAKAGEAIKRFFQPVGDFFKKVKSFLTRTFESVDIAPVHPWFTGVTIIIIYVIIALVLVALLGYIIYRIIAGQKKRKSVADLDELANDSTLRRQQEPSFWERSLQEAERLWEQGLQREALRVLNRACLMLLDAQGVLRYDESRANGEVLRELRRHGRQQAQKTLIPVVRTFDRSWYGLLDILGDEFHEALQSSRLFRAVITEERDAA